MRSTVSIGSKRGVLGLAFAVLLVLVLAAPALAQGQPPSPWNTWQFYGTVTINGAPAPEGTSIQALINSVVKASTTVDSEGRYGYSPLFYVSGNSGDTVTFKVGGTTAPQQAILDTSRTAVRLDLSIITTTLAVSTSAATNVGSRTATLNGNLTDMGGSSSVQVYFQYGTTTSYGSTTPAQTKTSTGVFSADITGLSPSTTYYFRAVAQAGGITVYGNPLTFTTGTTRLTLQTNDATAVAANSATLNGYLSDLGTSTSAQVYFQYGTTLALTSTTPPSTLTAPSAFSFPLSGLLANTTYYFRAVAQAGGTTAYGTVKSFTTEVGNLSVTTGGATAIGSTTATLNGTLTGLGAFSSAQVYFEYGTTTSYGNTTASQSRSSLGSFSASISGLTPNTTYYFRAVARAGGTTVHGSSAVFTTLPSGGTSQTHRFYGNVYIGGSTAPQGITVEAYVDGVLKAATTTDSQGRYGYTTLFYVPGIAGGTVTFKVAGATVPQTATWSAGSITRLDLHSPQTVLSLTCSAAYAGADSATLTGTVTSLGSGDTTVTVSFEWGTSCSALSSVTATPSTVTQAGQSFTATVTGLSGGQTYYYRAKATGNVSGTVYCPASGCNQYTHPSEPGALTITTTCPLSQATVGTTYSQTLTASGGSSPYTWSWQYISPSTQLPPGLTLSSTGTISGTPTTAGTFYFRLQVTDSASRRATKDCSLTVGTTPPPPPPPSEKLLGANDMAASYGYPGNYLWLMRFRAEGSGNVTTIKVKAYESGNVKVAIYADNAGEPGDLLGAVNAGTAVTASTWNAITLPSPVAVTVNQYYWLAFISDKRVVGWYGWNVGDPTAPVRFKMVSYSDFTFPTTAGTGYTPHAGYPVALIAGYK